MSTFWESAGRGRYTKKPEDTLKRLEAERDRLGVRQIKPSPDQKRSKVRQLKLAQELASLLQKDLNLHRRLPPSSRAQIHLSIDQIHLYPKYQAHLRKLLSQIPDTPL